MSDKTLTRADLVEAVVEKVGLARHEAAELVETVLQELSSTLASGEQVKLSSFGSFGIREKRQRIGRNPKTGQEVPITPRRVLVFRASNIMKKRIDETIKSDIRKANGKARPKATTKAKSGAAAKAKSTTKAKPTSKDKSASKAKPASKAKAASNTTTKKAASSAKSKKPASKKPARKKPGSSSKSPG